MADVELVLAGPARARSSVAGVVIRVPGSTVHRWSAFEDGYLTDGGMGGVWVQDAVGVSDGSQEHGGHPLADAPLQRLFGGADWDLTDTDDDAAAEGLLFGNGSGDGVFPAVRGFDAGGRVVAVAIWHLWLPWRVGVPEGTPPPDVTAHEDAIAACLARGGSVRVDDTCTR